MRNKFLLVTLILLASCDFDPTEVIDQMFGEQHFASAVATIELHKTRHGTYPNPLSDLEYLGEWDGIWISSVRYEKTETGYNLFISRGWAGEPTLTLPAGYRAGLGLEESNIVWADEE